MLVTTTPTVEGYPVTQYLRVVCGETIAGVNALKDMAAGFRNLVGGRSQTYEAELVQARESALAEMVQRAQELGAEGIVGVDIDYETLGSDNGMLMVTASGTAVRFSPVSRAELRPAPPPGRLESPKQPDREFPSFFSGFCPSSSQGEGVT